MTVSDLSKDVVEFLTGERRSMKRSDLILAIQSAAAHNNAWPKATFTQWSAAIAKAVERCELSVSGDVVKVAAKTVVKKDQMDLF